MLFINKYGIPMPKSADQAGVAISERIFPFYSLGMLVSTILLVVISATIVSYFPTRRISKMRPTDALKGKMQ
jgi:ABC-type lipoprotein release transport system permease subunit